MYVCSCRAETARLSLILCTEYDIIYGVCTLLFSCHAGHNACFVREEVGMDCPSESWRSSRLRVFSLDPHRMHALLRLFSAPSASSTGTRHGLRGRHSGAASGNITQRRDQARMYGVESGRIALFLVLVVEGSGLEWRRGRGCGGGGGGAVCPRYIGPFRAPPDLESN